MKDLKERLKTVQELLTNAEFIRIHAGASGASEANWWEMELQARKEKLEREIAAAKREPQLAHA
jgi:hypothetical protein